MPKLRVKREVENQPTTFPHKGPSYFLEARWIKASRRQLQGHSAHTLSRKRRSTPLRHLSVKCLPKLLFSNIQIEACRCSSLKTISRFNVCQLFPLQSHFVKNSIGNATSFAPHAFKLGFQHLPFGCRNPNRPFGSIDMSCERGLHHAYNLLKATT